VQRCALVFTHEPFSNPLLRRFYNIHLIAAVHDGGAITVSDVIAVVLREVHQ